ncbi:MAG: Flp pilus assembly complex ATPase component TadA [Proteobacteria bacterium]|nr:Flp pilus assembly complex ATPase component TadA [Pseudomonadota bacterium]
MTKKEISNTIDAVYRHCGQKETVIFCDQIMALGFTHACRAGISFGKDDLIVPAAKTKLVEAAQNEVKEFERQYLDGLITRGEKYNKVVDAWSQCTEKVAAEMMKGMSGEGNGAAKSHNVNSIFMMADSGARGSVAQMKQLAGMRGLMAKPSGEIIETPIIANFKEGLSVLEYFNSTHGARKGLADTALKTANSGYLTRRLVDVAQDCIIVEDNCGSKNGLTTKEVLEGGEVIVSLAERLLGRCASVDVVSPKNGEVIVKAGEMMEEDEVKTIELAGIETVLIRSVLTCDSKAGVCARCYGRDLARGTPVNEGEAIGVIAAQSIGEPGTQLTMRTFHIGGTAQLAEQSGFESLHAGTAKIVNRNIVVDSQGGLVVMGRSTEVLVIDADGREKARHKVAYGSRLLVDDGSEVKKGQKLVEWDPYTIPIITECEGVATYRDLVEGISMREVLDEVFGLGPIEAFLRDGKISDILVNGYDQIYIEKFGVLEKTDARFRDDEQLLQVIQRIGAQVGRRIDESSPMLDARLKDGSRVNAIIPPSSLTGPILSIRRFGTISMDATTMVELGTLTEELAQFLQACVRCRLNILISGGTGSGKTTLLNVISKWIPENERVVTIEDAAELQLQQEHVVRLETRPPNIEGKGRITIRDLLINSLRMRPDRIVVGECRGGETLDMLQAMNTGHEGSMTTIHANSTRDAVQRVETMVLMSGFELPLKAIRQQFASAIQLIVQAGRLTGGPRKILAITEVQGMEGDIITMQDIFKFEQDGVNSEGKAYGRIISTGVRPQFMERLLAHGASVDNSMFVARDLVVDDDV